MSLKDVAAGAFSVIVMCLWAAVVLTVPAYAAAQLYRALTS